MSRFSFLIDTYDTERLKTLGVWTGGLFQNGARVVYRYRSLDDLLAQESHGGGAPPLPGTGPAPVTERPGGSE